MSQTNEFGLPQIKQTDLLVDTKEIFFHMIYTSYSSCSSSNSCGWFIYYTPDPISKRCYPSKYTFGSAIVTKTCNSN